MKVRPASVISLEWEYEFETELEDLDAIRKARCYAESEHRNVDLWADARGPAERLVARITVRQVVESKVLQGNELLVDYGGGL